MIGMELVGVFEEWHSLGRFSSGSQKASKP
jgi:hypothetical protein